MAVDMETGRWPQHQRLSAPLARLATLPLPTALSLMARPYELAFNYERSGGQLTGSVALAAVDAGGHKNGHKTLALI